MLALCSMLSVTYYAQNYAGIIGWPLDTRQELVTFYCQVHIEANQLAS